MALMNPSALGFKGSALSAQLSSSSSGSSSSSSIGGRRGGGGALSVRCSNSSSHGGEKQLREQGAAVERREVLRRMGAAMALGSTVSALLPFSVDGGVAHANDIIQRFQRAEYLGKVKDKLRSAVKDNVGLVPELLKLALNDALTFDKATKTGGPNGSIRFELGRAENAGLEKAVEFLAGVKAELDESLSKFGPISWADLIQLGAQSATKRTFLEAAIQKCGGSEEKGLQLYTAYGSNGQWGQFDKLLGRADATGPDPEGRVPIWETASPAEISARFAELGIKPRYVAALSAFLGPDQAATESKLLAGEDYSPYVRKYQDSRRTVSQTDYEVDLINTFSKVSVLGQTINYEAYTYKPPRTNLRF